MPLPELNTDYDPRLLEKAMGAMNLKRSLLENAVLEQKQKYLPDMFKMEKEKTEQELETGKIGLETGKINLENLRKLGPSVLSKKWVDDLLSIGPTVSKQGYGNFYKSMMKTANDFGITPPVQLPAPVEINSMTDENFNKFKTESLTSLKQQIDKMTAEAHKTTAEKPARPSAPHTTIETSADGKKERTLIWDEGKRIFAPMVGPGGEWHDAKSQVPNINITERPTKMQQTQFIDDSDGTPLLFDPGEGAYKRPDGRPVGSAVRRQPADSIVAGATFETLADTAKSILADPKRHQYVGPFDSIRKRFKAATIGDADFSTFRTKIEQMIETSYALSGKQISAKEIEMLQKLRGSLDQPDKSFDAAMAEYLSWLENKSKTRKEAFGSQGYSTGKGLSKQTVMDKLRKANPGTSDTELEAYAKKKGYL